MSLHRKRSVWLEQVLFLPVISLLITVAIPCFLQEKRAFSQNDPPSNKPSVPELRYRVREGDSWNDTFERELNFHGKLHIGKSGTQAGPTRKVRVYFQDRLKAETSIHRASKGKFEVHIKILQYAVKYDVPVLSIDYDSREDTSGIYHRMFGSWIGKEVAFLLGNRGRLKGINGADELLRSVGENLPPHGGDSPFEKAIQVFRSMISKSVLVYYLKLGWIRLPEKQMKSGMGWSWGTRFFDFIKQGPWGTHKLESNNRIQFDGYNDSLVRFTVSPDLSFMHWQTMSPDEKEQKESNRLLFSRTNGVKDLQLSVSLKGTGKNRAEIHSSFSRKPLK